MKECPFCGNDGEVKKRRLWWVILYWVECLGCKARVADYRSEKAAVEAWEKRQG